MGALLGRPGHNSGRAERWGCLLKRFIIRSFIVLILLNIVANLARLVARKYLGHEANEADDEFRIVNIMGGSVLRSRAEALRTGNVNTVMGGTELDLREAKLAPGGAYLEVSTICGGTEILVPLDWRVEIVGTPQAGGHDLKVTDPDELPIDAPHLVVDARTICGGLEVLAKAPTSSQTMAEDGADTNGATVAAETNGATDVADPDGSAAAEAVKSFE